MDLGGRGAGIVDIVFRTADLFFANPGIRLPSVLFGFALEIEFGTMCSFHDVGRNMFPWICLREHARTDEI